MLSIEISIKIQIPYYRKPSNKLPPIRGSNNSHQNRNKRPPMPKNKPTSNYKRPGAYNPPKRSSTRSRLKSQQKNQKYQYDYDSYKQSVNKHTDKRKELQRAEERAKAQAQRLKENRQEGGAARRNRVSSAGVNRRNDAQVGGYGYRPVWWG